jgi:hypothetical protein
LKQRSQLKDNKQFQYRQNLNAVFGKLANGHQNPHGANNGANWVAPPPASSIWGNTNTSYSEIVAKPPIDNTNKMNQNFGMMNGHQHHQDHNMVRTNNSFNRHNDRYVDQEDHRLGPYGPIGTKKSPSSTPSWEPLAAGMNHYMHLAKPSPFNSNSSYFSQPPSQGYGMQQSKLMNLMSYNDTNAQQQQQQLQNQLMEDQYRYQMMKMNERQPVEWMNGAASGGERQQAEWTNAQSSNNYWSPAYRRESPTSPPPSSNWSSPSPPLAVPPGFEQQYQQPTIAQQNHQAVAAPQMAPYDPFKSLSAIWEPSQNRNSNNNNNNNLNHNRDTWDQ